MLKFRFRVIILPECLPVSRGGLDAWQASFTAIGSGENCLSCGLLRNARRGAATYQFRARPPAMPTVLLDDAVVRVTRWDFERERIPGIMCMGSAMSWCR